MSRLRFVQLIGGYTILGFLPVGVNFLLLPLYTSHLSPAQYGVLSEANVMQTFVQLAIGLGLEASFARYYFEYESQADKVLHLFGTVLVITFAVTLTMAIGAAFFGPWLFGALWTDLPFAKFGYPILLGALSQFLLALVFMLHRNRDHLRAVMFLSFMTTGGAALGTTVALTILPAEDPAYSAFMGKTAGSLLGLVPSLLPVFRKLRLRIDIPLTRHLLAYGLPLIAYSVLAYLLFNGDRVLMQRWFTLNDLGLYGLAVTLVSSLEIVLQAGQQAVQPTLYRALTAEAPDAIDRVGRFYISVVAACVVALACLVSLADILLTLIRSSRYTGATRFVAILGFAQLFRVLFNAYSLPLYFIKRTGALGIVTGLSIPVGFAAAFFTRDLGPMSIALGVLAWKVAQVFMTRYAASVSAPHLRVSLGPAYPLVAAVGLWAAALYVSAEMPVLVEPIRWVGAALLCFWSGALLLSQLRRSRIGHTAGSGVASVL